MLTKLYNYLLPFMPEVCCKATKTAYPTSWIIFLVLFLVGGNTIAGEISIRNVSISPDNARLLFDLCGMGERCSIYRLDLADNRLAVYRSPENEVWSMARYSDDGKQIVFIKTPVKDHLMVLEQMQIAMMNSDGSDIRIVTNSVGAKIYPSFSHSGKKIIFARAGRVRESGRTPAADYDIHEVDIKSGVESTLTHFGFFMASQPFYLPDDKHFIFAAEYPTRFPDVPDNNYDAIKVKRQELEKKYGENKIFLVDPFPQELRPLFTHPGGSGYPMIDRSGSKVYFRALAFGEDQRPQGIQVFSREANAQIRQHTSIIIPGITSGILSASISLDGRYLAVIYDAGDQSGRRSLGELVVIDTADNSVRVIQLPNVSKNIN